SNFHEKTIITSVPAGARNRTLAASVLLRRMDSLCNPRWVPAQVERRMEDWRRSAGEWSHRAPRFTARAQRHREKAYDRALRTVERQLQHASPSDSARTRHSLIASFARFAAEAMDLGPQAVDLLTGGFFPAAIHLAQWARRFDPDLSQAGIVQATRNAWTACGLQPLLGARLGLTPAILGYSLIYPYSDNFLDQKSISREQKQRFAERFGRRLRGELIPPANDREASLWQLVSLIERQFPRPLYPEVYAALLAIHRAQGESVQQLGAAETIEHDELLRITCAKGGTSVLADAYLVHGSLTAQQAEFAFAWGVLLQLGDDLQDIGEDLQRGSLTLFTRAVRAGCPLDGLVAQLLNFSEAVAAQLDALPHGDVFYRDLLRMSWRSLALMAVAQYPGFVTTEFAASLEAHSPFRFAFLRERRARLSGQTGLFDRLFQLILEDPVEDQPALLPDMAARAPQPIPA
ncbi:MAG TPA: hypothetical protein VJV22_07365, partial [Acidobacteriaceae bacterium]|nr:hypothetical protein [Acidobacteriaceae bacterium]